jgi:hypothetical protein
MVSAAESVSLGYCGQHVLREYDGLLIAKVTIVCRAEIERIASSAGLLTNLDVADGYVEFHFSGRDNNLFVVKMLSEMAEVIGHAQGEICCRTIAEDGEDPTFEFFTIYTRQSRKRRTKSALVQTPDFSKMSKNRHPPVPRLSAKEY